MDMITGIIIGIVATLLIRVLVAIYSPRRKGEPDNYERQQWYFEEDDE